MNTRYFTLRTHLLSIGVCSALLASTLLTKDVYATSPPTITETQAHSPSTNSSASQSPLLTSASTTNTALSNAAQQGLTLYQQQKYGLALPFLLEPSANKNATVQTALGHIYSMGVGTQADYAEALHWYEKAANQRTPMAPRYTAYL